MKRLLAAAALLLLLIPCPARGEELTDSLSAALEELPLTEWRDAYGRIFPEGEDFDGLIVRLARGERVVDGEGLLRQLAQSLLGTLTGSAWRLARLLVPAVFCGLFAHLRTAFARSALGSALNGACFLLLAGVLAQDLGDHIFLARDAVNRMAELMQGLFPLLLTLLAAVGGKASSAFFQPAVVAACGTMTALVRSVTLPLAMSSGLTVILSHLSPRVRIGRLAAFLRTAACWTLGAAFTVFLSVTALESLGTAAADGVSIRTAKYAVDQFVPVVGGMFADTMDALVGASLLIKNALGLTGLMMLLSLAAAPMIQTLGSAILYRACAALLEPLGDGAAPGCIQDFSDVLMLLFIIQLSVGAMFLLLVAQMLVVGNLTVMLR